MGGKGSVSSPPSSDWAELQMLHMQGQMRQMELDNQMAMARMQFEYQQTLASIEDDSILPPPPEITEHDIDWSSKIDELESEAYAEIEELTSVGASGGTVITSPLVWEEEPDVVTNLLTGS